ncbi:MAG: glycosyltransferase family 2 protein [Gemmataceae bacterium]|nr:glycosyltransferase family 2 protein [Gemmataceae bacterium]MDW8266942.1 glycosyltransferase family 2 protein [Gemmataceae bacterium]
MKHLIVIPAYNEETTLPRTVADLQVLPDTYELLIVNDGSRDRTGDVAEELARSSRLPLHVVHLPFNCGIGVAVQTGFVFAARRNVYHCVIQFDADGQHPADAVPLLVQACLEKGFDLCIGSRFLRSGANGFRSTWARRLGIRFFAGLISLLSGVAVTDPTSGFRCAAPKAWRQFARHYPEDYPEPESLFWCVRNKLRVGEVPVSMRPRQGGVSSIRWWRSVYYMVKVSLSILVDRLRAVERALT